MWREESSGVERLLIYYVSLRLRVYSEIDAVEPRTIEASLQHHADSLHVAVAGEARCYSIRLGRYIMQYRAV